MKIKLLFISSLVLLLTTSCSVKQPALYSWSSYSDATYNYIKSHSDEDKARLIKTYESIIKKQKGTRKCVPPGVYADYGYLLIESGEKDKGKEMLEKEIALYPESKVFIERIIKNL